jgi:EpsI family protein
LPHREQLATALLVASLVAVGAFAWVLQLRPELQVESSQLRTLPDRIDGWNGSSIPVEKTVESILRADANLQRIYQHKLSSEIIWLYVGYYGTTRGGRPEHTPRGCYTGAGWAIVTSRTLPVAGTDGLRVNEFRVAREGEERLVHFWYRSHRRTGMVGGIDQNLDRMMGRLLEGRADGALIRVSTPLPDSDLIAARSRLQSFAAALDPLIAARWPEEQAGDG